MFRALIHGITYNFRSGPQLSHALQRNHVNIQLSHPLWEKLIIRGSLISSPLASQLLMAHIILDI